MAASFLRLTAAERDEKAALVLDLPEVGLKLELRRAVLVLDLPGAESILDLPRAGLVLEISERAGLATRID